MTKITNALDVHPWVRTLFTIISFGVMLGTFAIWVNGAVVVGQENKKDIATLEEKVEDNKDKLGEISTTTKVTETKVDNLKEDIGDLDTKLDKVLSK